MWGTWLTVTFAGLGLVLLLIALAFTAAPLFAVAAVFVALAVASVFMVRRRQRTDPGSPDEARAKSEAIVGGPDAQTASTHPTRSGGAPVSGEGV